MGLSVCVLGAGGLLGRAVVEQCRAAGHSLPVANPRLSWKNPEAFSVECAALFTEFFQAVKTAQQPWAIVWCAGAGFVGVNDDILSAETQCLEIVLKCVSQARQQRGCEAFAGTFFFSSSAGGVFGNCADVPIHEASVPSPVSAYGRAKLGQEAVVRQATTSSAGFNAVIGRFSNLYGANQHASKPQGLISHIARSIVAHSPINIFVPLDVLRDYLHVRDAAAMVVRAVTDMTRSAAGECVLKIFAVGQPASVAEILGSFRKLTRRKVPTVLGVRPETILQPRRLVFHSTVHPEWNQQTYVPLIHGISEVLTAEQTRAFGHRVGFQSAMT